MEWTEISPENCTVARTLDVIGDRWSLLVLREVFHGVCRFAGLQARLGVARNVLSQRLATLVEQGVLERVPYQEPGSRPRSEYRLTPKGQDLCPVLMALAEYGDRWLADPEGPPAVLTHRDCGAPVHLETACEAGHRVTSARELRTVAGPGARRAG